MLNTINQYIYGKIQGNEFYMDYFLGKGNNYLYKANDIKYLIRGMLNREYRVYFFKQEIDSDILIEVLQELEYIQNMLESYEEAAGQLDDVVFVDAYTSGKNTALHEMSNLQLKDTYFLYSLKKYKTKEEKKRIKKISNELIKRTIS